MHNEKMVEIETRQNFVNGEPEPMKFVFRFFRKALSVSQFTEKKYEDSVTLDESQVHELRDLLDKKFPVTK